MISLPRISSLRRLKRFVGRVLLDRDIYFRNVEGYKEYNFSLKAGRKPEGVSVMLRAKNEENVIVRSVSSIYNFFDDIVFVDNGSTDRTLSLVRQFKNDFDKYNKIRIYEYPFSVARCGAEHAAADKNSISSLVYFYNWCLSLQNLNYVIKWDADMYLRKPRRQSFRDFINALQGHEVVSNMQIQTVYIGQDGSCFAARNEINAEIRVFPNRPYVRFRKGKLWEEIYLEMHIPQVEWHHIDVYEIKDTRKDEFSHWSSTNGMSERKKLEWKNFNMVKSNDLGDNFTSINLDD